MSKPSIYRYAPIALASALLTSLSVGAQCQLEWQPGPTAPGPLGPVSSLVEMPNGDLVAGGAFVVAGGEVVNNVTRWDGTSWQDVGGGVVGRVSDVVRLATGELFVVGWMQSAGGVPVANAAIWDGVSWSSPGTGLNSSATGLTVLPGGGVAVVGDFDLAGGVPCDGLAIWDGGAWSALPGSSIGRIRSVDVATNGDLIAVGTSAAGQPDVERWNGTSWASLPGIPAPAILDASKVLALPNGGFVVAGFIADGTATAPFGIYDGTQLVPLDSPWTAGSPGNLLVVDGSGGVLLGKPGLLSAGPRVYRYDGSQWNAVGPVAEGTADTGLVLSSGAIAVASNSQQTGPAATSPISIWSGGPWIPAGAASPFEILDFQTMPNGDVIVGGSFTEFGGVAANNIARWDGASWHALAQGVDSVVRELALAPDGTLLVAGDFATAGGAPAQRVARWNGATWSTIGSGVVSSLPRGIAENDAGEIVVLTAQTPNVHRFDGASWSTLATVTGSPSDVVALPSGDFLLLGGYSDLTQTPAQFSGGYRLSAGSLTLEAGLADTLVSKGVVDPNGDLLVAVRINGTSDMAVYVNGTLQPLGLGILSGSLADFGLLPNGELIVGGSFLLNGSPVRELARWDGVSLSSIDGGIDGDAIHALAIGGLGDLLVAGRFGSAGGVVSVDMARARTSCPASAATFGAGCTGSSGPVTFATDDLPWLETTWRAQAVGLPPQSLAVHAVGDRSAAVPLPLGAAGCGLFVVPVLLDLIVPQNGEVDVEFAIPNAAVLIGNDLFSQVVGLELDQSLALLQTTSSNALQLTVGSF